jgi:Transposase DDE domain
MRGPSPRALWKYVFRRLRLGRFFRSPGDGRRQPQISAQTLLWTMLLGQLLREFSFHGLEALVRSPARRNLLVATAFGDDSLSYFTERLHAETLRGAMAATLQQAKRNKAFENTRFIGLAVDGTTAGHSTLSGCPLCRPFHNASHQEVGYRHHLALISVVGTGLSLPFDVEPYGPKDSEYKAAQRLLRRARLNVGPRFADYLVVDSGLATAPFLHAAGDAGWPVIARLKENLPELFAQARKRFRAQAPQATFREGNDRIELWDADDFDPWETLRWPTVRVLFYRQRKANGSVIEAYWLTDLSCRRVGSRSLFHLAKSRWEIENQGFNDAKNRHGLEHICHHHPNSLLITWLITMWALTIERLYRLRYLHRGTHPCRTAIDLVRSLWLSLSCPYPNTS